MKTCLIKLIKYYPIVVNMWIAFSMIGVLLNFKVPILYTFFGQSFYSIAILLILSYQLRFCLWHRILIFSMASTLFLETLSIYGFKLNYYLYICIIVSVLSLILSSILYYKNGCTQRTFKNSSKNCKVDRFR